MIYSMEAEGMSINQSMLESLGLADSYIEFKADGTFVMALTDEEPVSGTYDDTAKTLTVNGESVDYTVSGNKVSLDIEGSKMTFAK